MKLGGWGGGGGTSEVAESEIAGGASSAMSGRSDPFRTGRRFHTESTWPTRIPSPGSFSPCTAHAHAAIHIPAVLLLLLHSRSAHPPLQTPVRAYPPTPCKTYARARPTALRRDQTLRGRPRGETRLLSLFSGVKGNKPSSVPHQVSCETIWHATLFIASLNQHLMVTLTGII